jgi:hypothetical protein
MRPELINTWCLSKNETLVTEPVASHFINFATP